MQEQLLQTDLFFFAFSASCSVNGSNYQNKICKSDAGIDITGVRVVAVIGFVFFVDVSGFSVFFIMTGVL